MSILLRTSTILLLGALAIGCATHPDDIAAKSRPANTQDYSQLDCQALHLRIQAVDQQLSDMYRELASQANIDALQLAASAIIPVTRIFLDGTLGHKVDEEGFARLKGRAIALRRTAAEKGCDGAAQYQREIAEIENGKSQFNPQSREAKPND